MSRITSYNVCYTKLLREIADPKTETKKSIGWVPPIGRVMETSIARAIDPDIRKNATDGGVVTALLIHLFRRGRIDGAIVTKQVGLV